MTIARITAVAALICLAGCGDNDTVDFDAGSGGTGTTGSDTGTGDDTGDTGDTTTTGTDTGSDTGTDPLDLFPLAIGNTWSYDIKEGTTSIGEKTQTVLELTTHASFDGQAFRLETVKPSTNRTISYQRKDGADTIRFREDHYKGSELKTSETYTPFKLRVSNDMLTVGVERSASFIEQNFDGDGKLTNEIPKDEEWKVMAIESITVPAGTFDNAVRVQRTRTITNLVKTYWFVPGVGKIKEIAANQTEELTGYTVK